MAWTSNDDWAKAIYKMYPVHKDRGHALPAIHKALKKVPVRGLLDAVAKFAVANASKDKKFLPYCATWMNGERWLDEEDKPETESLSAIRREDVKICPKCREVEFWPTDETRTHYKCRDCGHSNQPKTPASVGQTTIWEQK